MFIRFNILVLAFAVAAVTSATANAQSCSQGNCGNNGYVVYQQNGSQVVYHNQPVYGVPVNVSQPVSSYPVYAGEVVTTSKPVVVVPYGPVKPDSKTVTVIRNTSSINTGTTIPNYSPAPMPGQWTSGPVFPAPGGC